MKRMELSIRDNFGRTAENDVMAFSSPTAWTATVAVFMKKHNGFLSRWSFSCLKDAPLEFPADFPRMKISVTCNKHPALHPAIPGRIFRRHEYSLRHMSCLITLVFQPFIKQHVEFLDGLRHLGTELTDLNLHSQHIHQQTKNDISKNITTHSTLLSLSYQCSFTGHCFFPVTGRSDLQFSFLHSACRQFPHEQHAAVLFNENPLPDYFIVMYHKMRNLKNKNYYTYRE